MHAFCSCAQLSGQAKYMTGKDRRNGLNNARDIYYPDPLTGLKSEAL